MANAGNILKNGRGRAQRGFSLAVSLSMMIVATLVALGVMRAVDALTRASGSGLHAQTAQVAAQSGLAAGRSWVANNSYEAVALFESWIGLRNKGVKKPVIRVPLKTFSTSYGQNYEVFLTSFNPKPKGTYGETMEFTLQAVGAGQGGARRVITGVYRVRGLVLEIPKVEFVDSVVTPNYGVIGPEDAVYLGGGYLNDIQGPVTINGSFYSENGIQINPVVADARLTVNGDLVVGGKPQAQQNWINGRINVQKNAFFGDSIAFNSGVANADMTIDGNAEFHGLMVGTSTLHVKGNAVFYHPPSLKNGGPGTIRVDGNAIIRGANAAYAMWGGYCNSSTSSLIVGGNLWFRDIAPADAPASFCRTTVTGNVYYGENAVADSAAFVGNLASVNLVDNKKEQAFNLSYEAIRDYVVRAEDIVVDGQRAEEWGALDVVAINKWATSAAPNDKRLSGFVFISVAGNWPVFKQQHVALQGNIVFVFERGNQLWMPGAHIPPTAADANVGWWFRGTAAGAVGVDSTQTGSVLCNCFLYFETESCNNEGYGLVPPVDFRGAVYFAKETEAGGHTVSNCKFKMAVSGIGANPPTTFTFDGEVMGRFQTIPGFIVDRSGTPIDYETTERDTTRWILDTLLRATSPLLRVDYMGGYSDEQAAPELVVSDATAEMEGGHPYFGFTRSSLLLPKGRYDNFEDALDTLQVKPVWSWRGRAQHPNCAPGEWTMLDYEGNTASFEGDADTLFVARRKLTCTLDGVVDSATRKLVVSVGAGIGEWEITRPSSSSMDTVYSSTPASSEESSSSEEISSSSSSSSSSSEPIIPYEPCSYPDWSTGTTYALGDTVSYRGKDYVSGIAGNIGHTPGESGGGGGGVTCVAYSASLYTGYVDGPDYVGYPGTTGTAYRCKSGNGAYCIAHNPTEAAFAFAWDVVGTCGGGAADPWIEIPGECYLAPPYITSPSNGSKFNATTVTFSFTHGLAEYVQNYYLEVGTTYDGDDLGDGTIAGPGAKTWTASGLPDSAVTVYVRISAEIDGRWTDAAHYTYVATGREADTTHLEVLPIDTAAPMLGDGPIDVGCDIDLSPVPDVGYDGYIRSLGGASPTVTASLSCGTVPGTYEDWLGHLNVNWYKDGANVSSGTGSSTSIVMNANHSVKAVISKKSYTVNIVTVPAINGNKYVVSPAASNTVVAGDDFSASISITGFPRTSTRHAKKHKAWSDPNHTTDTVVTIGPVLSNVTLYDTISTIRIRTPENGDTLVEGEVCTVTYDANNLPSRPDIVFCDRNKCDGNSQTVLTSQDTGTGVSVSFTVPDIGAEDTTYSVWVKVDNSFYARAFQLRFKERPVSSEEEPSSSSSEPTCDYVAWNANTSYSVGAIVSYDDKDWRALVASTGKAPGTVEVVSGGGGVDCSNVPDFVLNVTNDAGENPAGTWCVVYNNHLWCNTHKNFLCGWNAYPPCGGALSDEGACGGGSTTVTYWEVVNDPCLGKDGVSSEEVISSEEEISSDAGGGGSGEDCSPWSASYYGVGNDIPGVCTSNDWCTNPIPICAGASCTSGETAYRCTGHGSHCNAGGPLTSWGAAYEIIGTCN